MNRRLFVSSMTAAMAFTFETLLKADVQIIKPWTNQRIAQGWLATATEDELLTCKCAYYSKGEIIFEKDSRYCNRLKYGKLNEIEWTIEPVEIRQTCIITGVCLIRPDGLNITQSIRQGKIAGFDYSQVMNPGDTLKCTYFTVFLNGRWSMEHYR